MVMEATLSVDIFRVKDGIGQDSGEGLPMGGGTITTHRKIVRISKRDMMDGIPIVREDR